MKFLIGLTSSILISTSVVFALDNHCAVVISNADFQPQKNFPQVLIEGTSGEKVIDVGNYGNITIKYVDSGADLLFSGSGTFSDTSGKILAENTFHQLVSPLPNSKPASRTAGFTFDLNQLGIGYVTLLCAEGNWE